MDFDWKQLTAELDSVGCALTPPLLTPAQCAEISSLYGEVERFRSTIDMQRYRFGSGQYRYFDHPLPELVAELREAFYPHLLPIARDWADRLGRPAPWPDTLAEWLDDCHRAGQTRPTPILLKYQAGDWNALHRDLYGDLVFPLQVVIGLDRPGGGAAPASPISRHGNDAAARPGADLHNARPPGGVHPRLVGGTGTPRRQHSPLGSSAHPRSGIPRRRLIEPLRCDRRSGSGRICALRPRRAR